MPSYPSVIPLHTTVKGRVRLKIEGLAHCQALKIELEATFSRQPDIRSASASSLALQLLPFFVPGLRRLLKIAPLTPVDLALAGANAVLALAVHNRLKHCR